MSSLDLVELQKFQNSRNNRKYDYFEEVLKKCHHKIRISASNFETQCFFPIPGFILGLPKYSQLDCCQYVMNKLNQDGLKVLFINPNILFITWDIKHASPTQQYNFNNYNQNKPIEYQKNIPKKIEYKPTTNILPTDNFIYDPKIMNILKNKTNKFIN